MNVERHVGSMVTETGIIAKVQLWPEAEILVYSCSHYSIFPETISPDQVLYPTLVSVDKVLS